MSEAIETGVLETPEQFSCERELQSRIVEDLQDSGYLTSTEHPMIRVGGRADILAQTNPPGPVYLIEVKTSDPLKGVGQLLAYSTAGWPHHPRLVLAIPTHLEDAMLASACYAAGIYLWRGDPPDPSDLVHPLLPDEHCAKEHQFGLERVSTLGNKELIDCTASDLQTIVDANETRAQNLRFNIGAYSALRHQLISTGVCTVRELYTS